MTEQQKEDLTSLRNELNRLDKEKEDLFSSSNRKNINELRSKVKILKQERNNLTDSVKKLKAERDSHNKVLKEKIEAFKKIAPPKKEKKDAPKVNVAFIKKEIKEMEYKVETAGLSFDKEQKLMKLINQKKKQIEGADENHSLSEDAKKLSREIDEIRAKADVAHKEMRSKADESQKKHEEVIKLSNQLNSLEKDQKGTEVKIREYKTKINEINEKLGNKLEEAISQKKVFNEKSNRRERPKFDKKEQHHGPQVNIEEMQHKAEEKLKKGQKLTTKDLMAFQNRK